MSVFACRYSVYHLKRGDGICCADFHKNAFKICLTLLDGGEPNGDDQFPGGTGEDVGDCCAPCAEEFKEGGGAVFSTFGF